MYLLRMTYRQKYHLFIEKMISDVEEGIVLPGEFLPSENDLSIMFDISRSSIRKGIAELVNAGLIERVPRQGNRVIRKNFQTADL